MIRKSLGAFAALALVAGFLMFAAPVAAAETECPEGNGSITGWSFMVNGTEGPFTTMQGNVSSGDEVTASFNIAEGCTDIQVSLASYYAPSATFWPDRAKEQALFDSATGTFSAGGPYTLSASVADCYFQTDFVRGAVINNLEAPDELYSAQGRLLDDAFGGEAPCQQPAAEIASDCTMQGGVVTLKNTGPRAVTFSVSVDGGTPTDYEVLGNSQQKHNVAPLSENQSALIKVTALGMKTVEQTVKLDCQHPAARIGSMDCAKEGVDVTLKNIDADLPVTFTIKKGADTVASVEVPADGTVVQNVAVAEDETALITVTAPGMTDVSKTVTRDCAEDEVEGDLTTPPGGGGGVASTDNVRGAVLARTGPLTEPGGLATIGFALLGAGAALIRRARKLSLA